MSLICKYIVDAILNIKKSGDNKRMNYEEKSYRLKAECPLFTGNISNIEAATTRVQKSIRRTKQTYAAYLEEYSPQQWHLLDDSVKILHSERNCSACFITKGDKNKKHLEIFFLY